MKRKLSIIFVLTVTVLFVLGGVSVAAEQEAAQQGQEEGGMVFLIYWELNTELPVREHMMAAKKVMDAGLFPPPGVKVLRFDKTPDQWGITIVEAKSAEAVSQVVNVWRVAGDGFFKVTKVGPAIPVPRAMQLGGQNLQAIARSEAAKKEAKKQ